MAEAKGLQASQKDAKESRQSVKGALKINDVEIVFWHQLSAVLLRNHDELAQREEFSKQASEQLVNIYAAMRPEAASEQLSRMDEITAAAILSRLKPRAASAILNDIPPDKAARLATILTGVSRKSDRGEKS